MKIIETDTGVQFDCSKEVTAGAALLDSVTPGWEHRIERDKLDLGHGNRCVLGQLAIKSTILDELIEAVDGEHEYDGANEALKDLGRKGELADVEQQFGAYKSTRYGFFIKEGKVREWFAKKYPQLSTPNAIHGMSAEKFARRSIEIQKAYQRCWDDLTQDWSDFIEKRLASA